MGMKPRPRDRAWYRRRIRSVNREFKRLEDQDGPKANRLMELKDKLIDELVAKCAHGNLIQAPPSGGFGPMSRSHVRSCLDCGETEFTQGDWVVLTKPAEVVDRHEHAIRLGRTLIDLGINIPG